MVVDATLVKFLSVAHVVPDILIIWIAYVAIREGQIAATVAGFLIGLASDLMVRQDMLGLDALAKCAGGFAAGYFYNENKIETMLGGSQFLVVVGLASVVRNLLYFIILLQGSGLGIVEALLYHGIPATAYTLAVSLLPMFIFGRKYLT